MADASESADHVLDASALAKLFLDEAESPAFRSWYLAEVGAGATFRAPSLLAYEIAHLLARNLKAPRGADAAAWLSERHREALTGISLDETAAERTFPHQPALTAYDASYLATAIFSQASLVTYDAALAKEARRLGVRTHSPA